jgi:hypothetical protein
MNHLVTIADRRPTPRSPAFYRWAQDAAAETLDFPTPGGREQIGGA